MPMEYVLYCYLLGIMSSKSCGMLNKNTLDVKKCKAYKGGQVTKPVVVCSLGSLGC